MTTPQAAWQFEVSTDQGVSGTLTVERGTGRWAQIINMNTGESKRGVYAYNATFTGVDGSEWKTTITSNDLAKLRRAAKRQAAESEA